MKRCLLICEGPFDELIFSLLKDIFDESLFEVKSLNRCCADIKNLRQNVESLVSEVLSREHGYLREDFDEICFLIDSDGIYINPNIIKENKELTHIDYRLDSIECTDRKSLLARNRIRIQNIADLLEDHVYWIFYNSRNLEHAFDETLYHFLEDKTKKIFSLSTFNNYDGKGSDFIQKLFSMNRSKTNNIYKSWDYLKKGCNSLSSTSNIFIFIVMHFYALKKEYKEMVVPLLRDGYQHS